MVDRRDLSRPAPELSGGDRQFLEPGAGDGLDDEEAGMVGEGDGGLEDILSAEEAAVHVVDEPGGMNYDPDPGYVDRETS